MTAALEETTISQHNNTTTTSSTVNMVTPSQQHHGEDSGASSVQVAVRIRPMLPHEAGNMSCVEVLKESSTSRISNVIRLGGEDGPTFTFDQVFPLTTTQSEVYDDKVAPLVSSCLEGYNATILAYGQTGSGCVRKNADLCFWKLNGRVGWLLPVGDDNCASYLFFLFILFPSAKHIPSWGLPPVFQRQSRMKDRGASFQEPFEASLIS